MSSFGDFSFFVDAPNPRTLAVAFLWVPSVAGKQKGSPRGEAESNTLLTQKVSLDLLCNFDLNQWLSGNDDLHAWVREGNLDRIWAMTQLLIDFVVVFIALFLARYHPVIWQDIIEARKTALYTDIRAAYRQIAEGFPYFFSNEDPFQYGFDAQVSR